MPVHALGEREVNVCASRTAGDCIRMYGAVLHLMRSIIFTFRGLYLCSVILSPRL